MCRDGAYLPGRGQSYRSIITSLEGEMVVKEHLDAGPHMESSRCVVDRLTQGDSRISLISRPVHFLYRHFEVNDSWRH